MKNSMTVHFRGGRLLTEESEKIEDKLAELLGELGYDARIESEITGNTTVSRKPESPTESPTKKFVVSLIFTVKETKEMPTAEKIKYFMYENGYVFFQGEWRDEDNETVTDAMILGNQMSIIVHEIDC